MKIVLNIEKRHLIFFSLFLVLVGSIFVIGAGQWNDVGTAPASGVGHQELYINNIYSWAKTGFIEIWDAKGNDLQLGSRYGEDNRFDFSVDSGDRILFSGRTAPNYQMDRFTVKAKDIVLNGTICSDEQKTNCKPVSEIINSQGGNGDEIKKSFSGDQIKVIISDDLYRIYGRDVDAKQFCYDKGYSKQFVNEVVSICSQNNPTQYGNAVAYYRESTSPWGIETRGCDPYYGVLNEVTCLWKR